MRSVPGCRNVMWRPADRQPRTPPAPGPLAEARYEETRGAALRAVQAASSNGGGGTIPAEAEVVQQVGQVEQRHGGSTAARATEAGYGRDRFCLDAASIGVGASLPAVPAVWPRYDPPTDSSGDRRSRAG